MELTKKIPYKYLVNERIRGSAYVQILIMTLGLLFLLYGGFMQEDFIYFGYATLIYVTIFYFLKDKFTGIKFNKNEVVILTFSRNIVYQLSDFQYIKTLSIRRGIYKIVFKNNDNYTFYFRDIEDFIDIFEINNADSDKMAKRIENKIRGVIPHNPL